MGLASAISDDPTAAEEKAGPIGSVTDLFSVMVMCWTCCGA